MQPVSPGKDVTEMEATNVQKKPFFTTYRIVFIAVMAAVIYVLTLFRFPLGGSKVHFANAACLLSGLLFGPVSGGLAAGLGSGLYDLLNGYGIDEALITTVSKFLMAFICALIAGTYKNRELTVSSTGFVEIYKELLHHAPRIVAGSVIGALSYVALYMLKHLVYQTLVYGNSVSAALAVMVSKLPASLINAVFAMLVAPVLYAAILPPLKKAGLMDRL